MFVFLFTLNLIVCHVGLRGLANGVGQGTQTLFEDDHGSHFIENCYNAVYSWVDSSLNTFGIAAPRAVIVLQFTILINPVAIIVIAALAQSILSSPLFSGGKV